jgi:hypothetical protein
VPCDPPQKYARRFWLTGIAPAALLCMPKKPAPPLAVVPTYFPLNWGMVDAVFCIWMLVVGLFVPTPIRPVSVTTNMSAAPPESFTINLFAAIAPAEERQTNDTAAANVIVFLKTFMISSFFLFSWFFRCFFAVIVQDHRFFYKLISGGGCREESPPFFVQP